MTDTSFYVLVQGRFYEGDIEGKRYHWRKGIPGSTQLLRDLKIGNIVKFIYYRTWDRETRKGKFFYGTGIFDNKSLKVFVTKKDTTEYFAKIADYDSFNLPVVVKETLRKKVWPGMNRQAGIKKISESIFQEILEPGLQPKHLMSLASTIGEQNIESLLNDQNSIGEFKDKEGVQITKRAVKTYVYKRARKTIRDLKKRYKRYKGICQITGEKLSSFKNFGVDVTEAHHIEYLSNGGEDGTLSNLIIISPEWHRMLHKKNPKFDEKKKVFIFDDGKILPIKYLGHLI